MEATAILGGLIERVVIHRSEAGREIELVGEIVRMVEPGAWDRNNKKPPWMRRPPAR